ncbi:uncharacterized protein SCHCODRAFT_02218258 [Schizophyllum commune H4-8]|uniref:uncharacterized protein n=1 Tax=Schizophyllum commune (strain H4-8 / FGSC 9210) TaxID=578458 RepID=UPI00215DDE50|nr:uncharacterized protein SCHCODRAFT_02218258 [Schizophyllum commune H4-8]KAI5894882.1 hypothetical protein SCHCODRAFT_02218258 [Schizophyllum commune H4-8]
MPPAEPVPNARWSAPRAYSAQPPAARNGLTKGTDTLSDPKPTVTHHAPQHEPSHPWVDARPRPRPCHPIRWSCHLCHWCWRKDITMISALGFEANSPGV